MKNALRYMRAWVVTLAPLVALGCADNSEELDPTDLCSQVDYDSYWYEPIYSFEPDRDVPNPSPENGNLLLSDDGTYSGKRPVWNRPGDGIVAYWPLGNPDDPNSDPLARCRSHRGDNTHALNVWGPLSGRHFDLNGSLYDLPNRGFNFDGGAVTLVSGGYDGQVSPVRPGAPHWHRRGVIDASDFDGISFWARIALPEEAVSVEEADRRRREDSNGLFTTANLPEHPGQRQPGMPQRGQGQLGILLQTVRTAAIEEAPTREGLANPTAEGVEPIILDDPLCADYSPWVPFCHRRLKEGKTLPPQCMGSAAAGGAGITTIEGGGPIPKAYCHQALKSPEPIHPDCVLHTPKGACARPEIQNPNYFDPGEYSTRCSDDLPDDPPPEEPVDEWIELEVGYRNQCWDGFRWVLEITENWRHYYVPFSEMRQLGWGRVAPELETDKIRSVGFMSTVYQPFNFLVDEVAFYKRIDGGRDAFFNGRE